LRDCLQENGIEGRQAEGPNWSIMMDYRGRRYSIYDDFSIDETVSGFNAHGCSYQIALGALFATETLLSGRARVLAVLDAVAQVDIHVRGPFLVEEIPS
jgi:hypothetical protein